MLTDDEIFLAIDDVPITKDYVVAVGRAIAAKVLEKLRPAEPLAVIGALERAAQMREEQAMQLAEANDYSAVYPEGDAKSLRDALDVFTRIGAGPSGVALPREGQPVAWYDPTNTEPGQSVTFDRKVRDKWPHRYPVALYAAGVKGTLNDQQEKPHD